MTTRFAYVGSMTSGRRTSLASILTMAGTVGDSLSIDHHDFELTWSGTKLVASVSTKRALFAGVAPGVEDEMDRLAAASGFIFVVDSQKERILADEEQLQRLRSDLAARFKSADDYPVVFQVNKRDLPTAVSMDEAKSRFASRYCAYVESIASRGIGASEALTELLTMIRFGQRQLALKPRLRGAASDALVHVPHRGRPNCLGC